MKKLLSLLLVLALLPGVVPALGEALPAESAEAGIPAVGDVIEGFEVKEIRDFPIYGARLVYFEHQKTGAKVLWIANNDTNRGFNMSFPTRPLDDTGLPHIFEHATMFGSEKYPSSALFFGLSYQTYNTFMTAQTADAMTQFPVASLSEEQLLALADYYVDSCFHPMIMTDESIFRTQAWHYNLPDMDSDLTYEGVVYSEVSGLMTLNSMALEHANDVTFPGAALSYAYGGMPESIPDMTWEDVKAYHDRYYHPSNSFTVLYGKLDHYDAFLKLLNSEFSNYEKVEFTQDEPGYTPITEPVTAAFAYPMAEGTNPADQSCVYYYILCPGMKGNQEQEFLIDHVCMLLNEKSSVLSRKMRETFPSGSVSCGREIAAPDDAIVFVGRNLNENDGEAFKVLVDEALAEVAAEGFPQDMVDSAMAELSISEKTASENSDPMEGVVTNFTYYHAVTGNPFEYAENLESDFRIADENRDGLLSAAAKQWLTGDVLYTLTTTVPAPGEKEKEDAALAEKLAEIKAGMSEAELQAIIDETNAPEKVEDASELIAKVKAVTVESLPEEVRTYDVLDETGENGIRYIGVKAGVDGIGKAEIMLDAAALPQEDIHWMRLFTRLLGNLDTDAHTKEELDVLSARYLYDRTLGVSCIDLGDAVHPYLVAEWIATDEDLATGYDLIEELIYHTQFTDLDRLSERISAQKTAVRNTINNSAYEIMMYRGLASQSPFYAYYAYLNFIEYYAFLDQLEAQMAEDPAGVAAHLQSLQEFFRNNAGAVAAFAGNEESIALNRPLADAFLSKLDHVEREAVAYELELPAKNEALITDSNLQFNNLLATLTDMGLTEADYGLTAIGSLVCDIVLVPVLRDQLGVYTPFNGLMKDGCMYLVSYLDPNVRETFDVYASLADRLSRIDVDQDTLDGYIMGAYSNLAKPAGELTGAVRVIEETMEGKDPEWKVAYMRQLKKVTPETVKAAAEIYRKAWENGTRSTAGSAAAINANADLYEVIMNPFNAKDLSDAEFTDLPEDHEYYAVVKAAMADGLMAPLSETAFGVDEPATVADFLGGVYVLVGGPAADAQACLELLAQYGLMDPATDLAAPLTEQFACDLLMNLGSPMSTDDPEHVMTRGELANLFEGE